MQKTWKPLVGGILTIICGSIGIITGSIITILGGSISWIAGIPFISKLFTLFGSPIIILGAVAIAGGIYAIKRKLWGLALAGSICAFLIPPPFILGIVALVFIIISKEEFE
jgi:hypothetical protein